MESKFIESATKAGIPVQGHAGLVQEEVLGLAWFKAVGKNISEAIMDI